jgi:ribosomal protein S18 acetylase RimI-like enzyme
VLVAADRFGPIAFVSGVADVGSFYARFFRQRGARAAWSAGARLLRPSIVKRAVETATYEGKDDDIPAELLSTAVTPPYRGRGIAGRLSNRLLDDLAADGIKAVKVVVAEENNPARRLYESVGFRDHDRIEVHEGEPSIVMASVR